MPDATMKVVVITAPRMIPRTIRPGNPNTTMGAPTNASPTTPPNPVGNGHSGFRGQQLAKPADCYAKHPAAEPQRFAVEITVADHPPSPHCDRQDQRDRPKAEGLHQKIGPDRAGIANDIMDWTRRSVTEVRVLHRPRHERRRDDPG